MSDEPMKHAIPMRKRSKWWRAVVGLGTFMMAGGMAIYLLFGAFMVSYDGPNSWSPRLYAMSAVCAVLSCVGLVVTLAVPFQRD